ncbi:uncharacterized protein LOC122510197 [Leptopilina heterotoma]|uniref:uncharacterized protein LOC122510197 n=1 Tax=Leptopilina heterotoma TaxID=63436 RepID=UPI001CA7EE69|nr:uncharacterized protein LOC122510197 [Leptopilina heterotoma]
MENFEDLSEETQKMLLEREIIFQNEKISLNKLISSENLKQIIDAETLVELKMNPEIKIGTKPPRTKDLEGAYCTLFEEISMKGFINTLQHDNHNIYIISGIAGDDKKETLIKHLNDNLIDKSIKSQITDIEESITRIINTRIQIFDNQFEFKQFKKICGENFDKRIYWIKLQESKLKLTKIYKPDFYLEAKRFNDQVIIDRNIKQLLSSPKLSETFIFINITKKQLTSWLQFPNEHKILKFYQNCNHNRIRFVTSNENSFECILKNTSQLIDDENPKEAVHLLEFRQGQIVLLKSHGSLEELSKHRSEKYKNSKSLLDERDLMEKIRNQKCVIIAGCPGVGKSTSMIKLLEKFGSEETHWVIRIDLEMIAVGKINFSHDDNDANDKNGKDHDANDNDGKDNDANDDNTPVDIDKVADFLLDFLETQKNSFTKTLLNLALRDENFKRPLLLAFDGFDNLDKNNRSNVISLLKFLKDKTHVKLLITTPPNCQQILEASLSTFAVKLEAMDDSTTTEFIKNYLNNFSLLSSAEEDDIKEDFSFPSDTEDDDSKKESSITYVQSLLAKMQKVFNCSESFGNPLLINLILHGSAVHFKTWLQDKNKVPDFSYVGDDLWEVLENFIERSYNIYFQINSEENTVRRMQDKIIFDKYHKDLAKFLLFKSVKEEYLEELKEIVSSVGTIRYHQINSIQSSSNLTQSSVNLTPSTVNFTPSSINFAHPIFSEYFSTKIFTNWIRKWKRENGTKFPNAEKKKFFTKVLVEPDFRIVRKFLNTYFLKERPKDVCFEKELYHPTILFRAIEENNPGIVNFVLDNFDQMDLNSTDENGTSLLCTAVISTNFDIVQLLIHLGATIDTTVLYTAVETENLEVVQFLLKKGADINCTDKLGRKILQIAADSNFFQYEFLQTESESKAEIDKLKMVRFLIEQGADIHPKDDRYSKSLLEYSVEISNFTMVEFLLGKNFDVNARDKYGRTVLYYAFESGNLQMVEFLLKKGADINIEDNNGIPMWTIGFETATIEIVDLLIKNGVDVDMMINYKDYSHKTLLHTAALSGSLQTFEFLAKNGANLNAEDQFGKSVLHFAVTKVQFHIIEFLVQHGAKFNAKDLNEKSVLHYAVEFGTYKIVEYLVENGAKLNDENIYGETILHYACKFGDLKLVDFLVQKGAVVNAKQKNGKSVLHYAAERGDFKIVKYLVTQKAEINEEDNSITSILHSAAGYGSLEMVKFLVAAGANVRARDQSGRSVLHRAVDVNNLEMVKFLMNGVDKDEIARSEDHYGATLLHIAAENNNFEMVRFLTEQGAIVNAINMHSYSVLHTAIESADMDMVEFLINKGAKVNVMDRWGITTLHIAANKRDFEMVNFLIQKGADVNAKDHNGRSVLHCAAENGNQQTVEYLIEKGANVYCKDQNGRGILQTAVVYNQWNLVQFLLEQCDDQMKYKNKMGCSLIHKACETDNFAIAEFLLQRGADINEKYKDGSSLLHCATKYADIKLLEFLLKHGADIHAKDNNGKTALQYVSDNIDNYSSSLRNDHDPKKTIELLTSNGADINSLDIKDFYYYPDIVDYIKGKQEQMTAEEISTMENFEDLSEETQKMLLEREIIFQNEKISLNKLISSENLKQIIDAETLVELKMNQEIKIGTKPPRSRDLEGAYFTLFEEISMKGFINTLQHDNHNIYIISGIAGDDKKETLIKHLNDNLIDKSIKSQITDFEESITRIINTRIQIFDNQFEFKQFKKICGENFDKRIYWIKLQESKLKLTKIYKTDFYLEAKRFNDQVIIDRNIKQLLSSPKLSETFIFINITKKQLTSWLQFPNDRKKFEFEHNYEHHRIRFVTSNENSFECILKNTSQLIDDENPKEAVHLLEFRQGQIVLLKSHGSLEELSKHRSEKYKNSKSLLDERDLMEKIRNQKCVIIAGCPGIGKSTSMIKLLEKFGSEETHWVIRIDLEMKEVGKINFSKDDDDANDNDGKDPDANNDNGKDDDANNANDNDGEDNYAADNDANDNDAFGSLLTALSLSSLSLGSDSKDSDATDNDADDINTPVNLDKVVDFLLDLQETQKNSFTKTLLNLALRDENFKRPLLLAFDGFDNLNENNRSNVISLLKFLKEKTPVKLLITTPPNCQQILEASLSTFAIKLEAMDNSTTTEFIKNYLNNFSLLSSTEEDDSKKDFSFPSDTEDDDSKKESSITYVQSLLAKMQKVFNCSESFGNPLLINLILHGSAEHFKTWLQDKNKVPDFSYVGDDLWEVLENFIERSYNIYFQINSEENTARRMQDKIIFDKYHKDLAKFLLFKSVKEEYLEELKEIVSSVGTIRYHQINSIQSSSNLTQSSVNLTPSTVNFTPSSINFTHPIFSEYFSTKIFTNWIRKWKRENGTKFPNAEKKKFFTKVLVEPDFRIMRKFLNTYFLKERPKDVCFEKELYHPTILFRAIEENNPGIVNFVLDNFDQMDLNSTDENGTSLLCTAVISTNFDIVQLLINLGATIDATVLHTAVATENLKVVKFLLKKGADVNCEDKLGHKILKTAADSNFFQHEFLKSESVSESESEIDKLKMVRFLIEQGADIHAKDRYSKSLLEYSVEISNFNMVEFVLQENFDVNARDCYGRSSLYYAFESGNLQMVEFLLKKGADINIEGNYRIPIWTIGFEMATIDMIDLLIKHGINVDIMINYKDYSHKTLLHTAALSGSLQTFEFLAKNGANLNAKDQNGKSVLHYAVTKAQFHIVKFLIQHDAKCNAKDQEERSVLHYAVEFGTQKIVEYLIENDAKFYDKDRHSVTILHNACKFGNLKLIDFLVRKGAVVNAKDKDGKSVLHYAAERGDLKIVKYLVKQRAKINERDKYVRSILHSAAGSGNLEMVKFLVAAGANVRARDKSGRSVLHRAVDVNNLEMVKFLMNDVDEDEIARSKDDFGTTLLHTAGRIGNLEMVRFLTEQGANVNAKNKEYYSVLHSVMESANKDIVEFLVNQGAKVNFMDRRGRTILHLAAEYTNFEIVKFLIEKGANILVADENERTILHIAAIRGDFEMVNFLIQKGADVNAKDDEGRSVLHCAAESGSRQTVEYLIEKGANVHCKDQNGRSILQAAVIYNHSNLVQLLLEQCEDQIKYKNKMGSSLIHLACETDNFEIAEFLLQRGADINEKYKDGSSLLHYGTKCSDIKLLEFLLKNGADIHAKDNNGKTALQNVSDTIYNYSYSWRYDRKKTIDLLTRYGADINSLDIKDFHYYCDIVDYIKTKQGQKTEE